MAPLTAEDVSELEFIDPENWPLNSPYLNRFGEHCSNFGSSERSANEPLGTDQTRLNKVNRQSDRPVAYNFYIVAKYFEYSYDDVVNGSRTGNHPCAIDWYHVH